MFFRFKKYQGTGNDFILIDDREERFDRKDFQTIALCCDRRFGIGADGLILLRKSKVADFTMVYFNADGHESTLCGNGARCTVAFAASIGIIENNTSFEAIDGIHSAVIDVKGNIALRMHDVDQIISSEDRIFLDTGSPHHIEAVQNLSDADVVNWGRQIRNSEPYGKEGTNVNFVEQKSKDVFDIRTYERGVEDETLSCGTGATAVALAMYHLGKTSSQRITIGVKGGQLQVTFCPDRGRFKEIDLIGPAKFVFEGQWQT